MSDVERRMEGLEQRVGHVERDLEALKVSVKTNTDLTRAIKDDTAELVVLLKGGKVFGKFVSWFVGLSAGVAGLYAMLKGYK